MSEPSGRELDKAIAELLGWSDFVVSPVSPVRKRLFGLPPGASRPKNGNTSQHREVPEFSGDDWQLVVEAMAEQGYTVLTYWWAEWEPELIAGRNQCTLFAKDDTEVTAVADTIGAAVALASLRALRAVEEEK